MIQKWQYFESNLILSERESQIIIGTLLGTSSIVFPEKSKNPHLLMRSIKKKAIRMSKEDFYEKERKMRPIYEDPELHTLMLSLMLCLLL